MALILLPGLIDCVPRYVYMGDENADQISQAVCPGAVRITFPFACMLVMLALCMKCQRILKERDRPNKIKVPRISPTDTNSWSISQDLRWKPLALEWRPSRHACHVDNLYIYLFSLLSPIFLFAFPFFPSFSLPFPLSFLSFLLPLNNPLVNQGPGPPKPLGGGIIACNDFVRHLTICNYILVNRASEHVSIDALHVNPDFEATTVWLEIGVQKTYMN